MYLAEARLQVSPIYGLLTVARNATCIVTLMQQEEGTPVCTVVVVWVFLWIDLPDVLCWMFFCLMSKCRLQGSTGMVGGVETSCHTRHSFLSYAGSNVPPSVVTYSLTDVNLHM
jgi:hypothetical protein